MASNWLYIDTQFPTFTGAEDTEEKISTIQNYLFMLVEQLRYTLHNLDMGNMNTAAMSGFSQMLTEPIYAMLSDEAGNIANLAATAERLSADMYGADGKVATLELTAAGLAVRVSNAEGSVSSLTQTADAIRAAIMSNGEVSAQLIVGLINGTPGVLIDASRVNITADNIDLSGYVTVSSLKTPGATTINGGNITTGTIAAENLAVSNTFELTHDGETYGYVGCGYGYDGVQRTYGAYLSSANENNYFITTNAGARMTAGQKAQIYVIGGENASGQEVAGQAVMEAEGTRLVVNDDGVFVVRGGETRRVVTESV